MKYIFFLLTSVFILQIHAFNLKCQYVDVENSNILTHALDDIICNRQDSIDEYFLVSYNDLYYDISPSLGETVLTLKNFKSDCLGNILSDSSTIRLGYSVYKNYYIFIDSETIEKLELRYSDNISHNFRCITDVERDCNYKIWNYLYKNNKLYKKIYNAEIVPLPGENFIWFYPMRTTDYIMPIYCTDEVGTLPKFPGRGEEKFNWLNLSSNIDSGTNIFASKIIPLRVIILKSGFLQLTEEADFFIKNNIEFGSKIYERLKSTPKWIPATINGNPVDVFYYLNFRL